MREDADAAIDAFGKNEHVRKIFRAVFVAVAGMAVTRVLDPATTRKILHLITGTG